MRQFTGYTTRCVRNVKQFSTPCSTKYCKYEYSVLVHTPRTLRLDLVGDNLTVQRSDHTVWFEVLLYLAKCGGTERSFQSTQKPIQRSSEEHVALLRHSCAIMASLPVTRQPAVGRDVGRVGSYWEHRRKRTASPSLRTSPASGRPSGQRDSLAFEHAVQVANRKHIEHFVHTHL